MSITYGASPGTVITEFAYDETPLGSQDQQSGNNTVVSANLITAGGTNGQIGTKFPSFVGRLVIINIAGASPQIRMVTGETAGTPPTRILTVNENWDSNPTTSDTFHAFYDVDDIETGGAGGGVGLNAKTGLYEFTNKLTIGDGSLRSGLQINTGVGIESNDGGATLQNIVKSSGYLYMGYSQAGNSIAGGGNNFVNNAANEPTWQFQSGSKAKIIDSLLWGQLPYALFYECAAGSAVELTNSKIINLTYASTFFGTTITNSAILGRAATTELIRLSSTSVVNGLVLVKTGGLATASGDTTTETITVRGVIFVSNAYVISVNSNKTWYVINPTWSAVSYSDFNWLTSTANYVYDQRSIDAIVQQPDGTKIQNANVLIYENTLLADLVLETYTNSLGVATGAFTYKKHSTNSSTLTYGGHALRVDCWTYMPFVSAQISTSYFNGTIVLNPDTNVSETNQATALSAGSGITWNAETNASSIISYTSGTGTLSVGATITQATSGATGVVTKIVSGDSAAGTVHLQTRNATAFSGTYGLSTPGGWAATYTASSEQRFSKWIDGNNYSLQIIHDYLAALTSETTLSATGELIHEWGRDSRRRALNKGASGFYTLRSYTNGVFITNCGAGTVAYFTDDAGGTWTPPTSVTLTLTGLITGSDISILVAGTETERVNVQGNVGTTYEWPYTYSGPAAIDIGVFKAGYVPFYIRDYDLSSSNASLPISQEVDRFYLE